MGGGWEEGIRYEKLGQHYRIIPSMVPRCTVAVELTLVNHLERIQGGIQ